MHWVHMVFDSHGFATPKEFWDFLNHSDYRPDLVISDIVLPEEDGLKVLQKLRTTPRFETLPVILLSCKANEYDRVKGLNMGADDYVCKPFGVTNLFPEYMLFYAVLLLSEISKRFSRTKTSP